MSKISHILYGSQTGNAESIARDLHEKCINLGVSSICCTLNEAKSIDLKNESNFVVIICATTGNGDAPENADSWWRSVKLRSTAKDKFGELPYLTLGLGDTNYDKFCYMGKSIDKRMSELGAIKRHDLYCADEATNLEEVVEEFKIKAISFLLHAHKSNIDCIKKDLSNIPETESVSNTITVDDSIIGSVHINIVPVEVLKLKDIAKLYDIDISTAPEITKLCRCTVIDETIDSTKLVYSDMRENAIVSSLNHDVHEGRWCMENPYRAEVLNAYYLTKNNVIESNVNGSEWDEQRRVIHLDLLTDNNIAYEPGDAIGICCPNRGDAVAVVMDRLRKVEPEKDYSMNTLLNRDGNSTKFTLGELLTYKIDLTTSLKKSDVMLLSKFCVDDSEKNQLQWLCSKGELGKSLWSSFVESQAIGLAELLVLFPSCSPKLSVFYHYPKFEVLNPMMPRYYSIACSPAVNSRKISIAFSVLQYSCGVSIANDNRLNEIKRSGLCTSYLESILKSYLENSDSSPDSLRIPIFLKPTIHFRLPGGISHPLILIGPGTGVAPFIGFLEHRLDAANSRTRSGDDICTGVWRGCFELEAKDLPGEGTLVEQYIHSVAPGPIILFFGCRDENDFLYKNILHKRLEQGVLSKLEVSMSRISSCKNYVQHRIIEKGEEIASLIMNDGAYIFVCGDGNRMAKDVHSALKLVVSKYSGTITKFSDNSSDNISHVGHMDDLAAEEYLNDLKARRRYVFDIWS